MSTTADAFGSARGRLVAFRGPAAMAVMGAGMLDTMVPGLGLLPAALWVAVELGLALVVAVPDHRARGCTPLAAHRALGLIAMAALTVAMTGMRAMADSPAAAATAGASMPRMHDGALLLPVALAIAGAYCAWSLWRARSREGRVEATLSAASVALMAVLAVA